MRIPHARNQLVAARLIGARTPPLWVVVAPITPCTNSGVNKEVANNAADTNTRPCRDTNGATAQQAERYDRIRGADLCAHEYAQQFVAQHDQGKQEWATSQPTRAMVVALVQIGARLTSGIGATVCKIGCGGMDGAHPDWSPGPHRG